MSLTISSIFLHVTMLSQMELVFALLRYAMHKFSTCLTMNYPFCLVILNHSLFETKVDIVCLISFVCELLTRLTKIQGHAKSTFQTLFSLLIRVFLLF
jgi:hypothetical protein